MPTQPASEQILLPPTSKDFQALGYAESTARIYAASVAAMLNAGFDGNFKNGQMFMLSDATLGMYKRAWSAYKRGSKRKVLRRADAEAVTMRILSSWGTSSAQLSRWLTYCHTMRPEDFTQLSEPMQNMVAGSFMPRGARMVVRSLVQRRRLAPKRLRWAVWGDVDVGAQSVFLRLPKFNGKDTSGFAPGSGIPKENRAHDLVRLEAGELRALRLWASPMTPDAPLIPAARGWYTPCHGRFIKSVAMTGFGAYGLDGLITE